MKLQKTVFLFCLVSVAILAVGCVQPPGKPSAATFTLPVVRSATPSPTVLPTRTVTPTVVLTLPVEQARKHLLELLADNGGCQLPCFWGITPGKSTYDEARALLEPLASISNLPVGFDSEGGSINPVYSQGDLMLFAYVGVNMTIVSNIPIVSRIHFTANEAQKIESGNNNDVSFPNVFDSTLFSRQVYPYTLSHVLSNQGIPTDVLISTDAGPDRGKNVSAFELALIYPDTGLFIVYSTYKTSVGKNVRGCPANAHVELEVFPSGEGNKFSEFLSQTQWANMWPVIPDDPFWKPIEKATSMTLQQFYDTFSKATDKCIETPAQLWPKP